MTDKLDPDTAVICDACNGSGFSADHYCGKCGGAGGIPPEAEAADEITRLNALIDELVEALEPFAAWEDEEIEGAPDDMSIGDALYDGSQPTVGDLRRARSLILKARSGGSDG